jgi:hypothetical protein
MKKILYILFLTFVACKSGNVANQPVAEKPAEASPLSMPRPHVLVYKTRNDYSQLVPVLMSDDKTKIVSYPHPGDLKGVETLHATSLQQPVSLKNGYWLDRKGIGINVAFLKYTYEEYSKLQEAPTLEELYKAIIDKDPLVELYDCGNKATFTDIEKQLNESIDNKQLEIIYKRIK